MKTELPLLKQLYIVAPCPAKWSEMQGSDQVRHCNQCNQKVYNLSQMTNDDAEALLVKEEGKVCVRFYRRLDGTISTRDCPKGLAARAWNLTTYAVAAAFMLTFGWLFYFVRGSSNAENTFSYVGGGPCFNSRSTTEPQTINPLAIRKEQPPKH